MKALVILGVLVAFGIGGIVHAVSGGSSSKSAASQPTGSAQIAVVGKSWCMAAPSQATIFTQVTVQNTGNAAGDASPMVDYRYSDNGSTMDGPSAATVQPGQRYVFRFRHDYNAQQHDVVECTVSLDSFNTESELTVAPALG